MSQPADEKPKRYPSLWAMVAIITALIIIPIGIGIYAFATSPNLNPNLPVKTVYVNKTLT